MSDSPKRPKGPLSEANVRLWPCAHTFECGMILPNDKQDRSKFSSKVSSEGGFNLIGGCCALHGIGSRPFQGLRKMLLYAKTKHAKNYPWMRYVQEAVVGIVYWQHLCPYRLQLHSVVSSGSKSNAHDWWTSMAVSPTISFMHSCLVL